MTWHRTSSTTTVSTNVCFISRMIFCYWRKNADSHCPILVTIEPSEMSRQEKFLDPRCKEVEGRREEGSKGKAKASTWGILFIRKDNFIGYGWVLSILCLRNDEWLCTCHQVRWYIALISLPFSLRSVTMHFRCVWCFDHALSIKVNDGVSGQVVFRCCFNFTQCDLFLPCQVPCIFAMTHQMNWFCFCCFFEILLWWSQTVEVEVCFCCFLVRIQNAKCCKAIWAPMMKLMATQFCTFLVRSMSLSVENFLRRAHLNLWTDSAWPGKKFSYGVSLTQFEHDIWCLGRYIRADLGITFSASAALPVMRLML